MAAGNPLHPVVGALPDLFAVEPNGPSAVLLEGEPGIGKTTHLLAAAEQARSLGFTVLSAAGSSAETVLAYAALADLLSPVDLALVGTLPAPQRHALDQVLLHTEPEAPATDQRAVAAAFLSTLKALAERSPVLMLIDDVQWLDPSSTAVLSFAVRRLSGPICVLAAVRTEPGVAPASWLRLARPDDLRRVVVPPLNLGAMHAMIQRRQGRSLSRPALTRIHRVSGGNPFYALELSRAVGGDPSDQTGAGGVSDPALPGSLTEVVRAHLDGLGDEIDDILLTAACATTPTISLLTRALTGDGADVTAALERAEDAGVLTLDGDRLRFTHPLLAEGVHARANPAKRRASHRRLADAVREPELRARHLALAATGVDATAVEALDIAAESARRRGAPAAAAELTELALNLGGDTPDRRIRLSANHFDAGEPARARALLEALLADTPNGPARAHAFQLLGTVRLFSDNFLGAAEVFERALAEGIDEPTLEVSMRIGMAFARYNAGLLDEGLAAATDAVSVAENVGLPSLLSQALGMRVILGFLAGQGFDEDGMRRALEAEGDPSHIPVAVRPSVQNALLQVWSGRDPGANKVLRRIRQECIDTGDEIGLNFITFQSVIADVWIGATVGLADLLEDTLDRAQQSGSDIALFATHTARATLAAYQGDEDIARSSVAAALAAGERSNTHVMAGWAISQLGFLEVSLGNFDAAWTVLSPLVSNLETRPEATELVNAVFVPDAIEAAVATRRADIAEMLADTIEANGRRVDRPWMRAVGARGRALVLASGGDVDAAVAAVREALVEHTRLPMRFETARSQLLLGQLLRRQRSKEAASAALREALETFEHLGTRLWAARARAELTRTAIGHRTTGLTPSEERVASLAATGMTNREVAAALFISPKTVEANLARVYRKLGIRTRAELGTKMATGRGTPAD